jgi:hypothetical protein
VESFFIAVEKLSHESGKLFHGSGKAVLQKRNEKISYESGKVVPGKWKSCLDVTVPWRRKSRLLCDLFDA